MYSEKVFQLGYSLLLTNAGMGNIQNAILLLKALYGDLYNIDDLINELKSNGYKAKEVTITKVTNW